MVTYLNSDENTDDAHHYVLGENSCDIGVLIVVDIEQTVAEYNR